LRKFFVFNNPYLLAFLGDLGGLRRCSSTIL
jgi:hypothetical protein